MSEDNKSYRIRTEINSESPFYLNVNLNQDYKNFEILSLNLDSESLYKMFTSEYGCIVGRVLANDSLGIPNAKVSIFIPTKESDDIDPILRSLYPYESVLDKNDEHIRYNTLPDEIVNECHQSVGTFPNKRLVLDDNNILEIFDKYYRYSTVTNNSGDYMIYGVPVGEQTVHVDIDLSDIGELSQRPIDMMYKGYDRTQFESPSMFNKSTDIDKLTQIFSQNHQVYVKPFWGNDESQQVSITRCDVSIQYKFEPTCIFIGSIITDSQYAGFSKKCVPSPEMGRMDNLIGTSGTIEIIRKTPGDNVESLVIQGTQLIDGSGRWCFQIPMNLDFVGTDEYGNRIATNDPNKGVPTRTRVRFRISSSAENDEYSDLHITKVLVPHNPKTLKDIDYAFGDKTKDNEEATLSFRDLFKDNVYTVKSYIPRIQRGNGNRSTKFSGIKNITVNNGNNEIPYNNMRVNITFMFTLQCAILKILIFVVSWLNQLLSGSLWIGLYKLVFTGGNQTDKEKQYRWLSCISIGDAICPDMEGWYFAPGCDNETPRNIGNLIAGDPWEDTTALRRTYYLKEWGNKNNMDSKSIDFGNNDSGASCLSNNIDYLMQCVEIHLAMEHNVIQFDFYNDWLNGTIYIPKWFGTIKKKRSYFFGLFRRPEKIQACMEDTYNKTRHLTQQCALTYRNSGENGNPYNYIDTPVGCKNNNKQECHKRYGRKYIKILGKNGGVVHKEETMRLDNVYYLRPMEMYDERLIFLFATDIVLLGSISHNNIYGIPYVFNGLSASSYKFPTLLAMTNLQDDSTQYTVCENDFVDDNSNGVSPIYAQEEDANDGSEYMYTEFAGVDWGYVGPGQGGQNVNSLTDLYFPGGHFLGISCFNTETNIKSCVNLSRACEIGTSFSHFTEIPNGIDGDDKLKYIQYNANGLISRREITDSIYRNIFATLNFNELKTVPNSETLQREYQFLSNFSSNFDGVLKKPVNNDIYKAKRNLELITSGTSTGESWESVAYGTAFEDYDIDYYRFRFGTYRGGYGECFAGREENKDKITVTYIPIYNNSFYFYFGIKHGETAFDKLHEDYYSLCTNTTNTIPSIETSNITYNDFCEIHEGTATIEISQISSVYKIYFEYRKSGSDAYIYCKLNQFIMEDNVATMSPIYDNNEDSCEPSYKIGSEEGRGNGSAENGDYLISIYKKILFKDLLNGDYIVYVQMLNDSYEYKTYFSIAQKPIREDENFRNIVNSISVTNFKNGIKDPEKRKANNMKHRGYISLIPSDKDLIEEYIIKDISGNPICTSDGNRDDLDGYFYDNIENGTYEFYVPSGDTRYYVKMKLNCPERPENCKIVEIGPDYGFTIPYGELPLDYYFTNVRMEGRIIRKLLTGSININKLNGESNSKWFINEKLREIPTNDSKDPNNDDSYSASRLAWLEYALVYNKSMFEVAERNTQIKIDEEKEEDDDGNGSRPNIVTDAINDNIFLGFSTIDGTEPKYNIHGNKIDFTSNFYINVESLKPLESLVSLSEMPVYFPTSSIVSDKEGKLTVDHFFEDYIAKLKDLGFTPNFQGMFIPALYDYELEFLEDEETEINE